MSITDPTAPVQVRAAPGERHEEILTPAALDFLRRLDSAFAGRRSELLTERRRRTARLADGSPLDFSRATSAVRADPGWRVAPPAPGLHDRRVEITLPPEPRMTAVARRSGAQVWTADFDDATAPTWDNIIGGQLALLDATAARTDGGSPGDRLPTLQVRPRGWHLTEEHLTIDGHALPASLVDFGLFFFHCARRRIEAGQGPYFCLPKLENRYEARLWNDVFLLAQELLGIPRGTVRATVPVETVTAAFEMEEILYELREHSAGLQATRWGYLFSLIRTFAHRTDFVLLDRDRITMTAPFLRAYTDLLVRTCHRRGAHAVGGVAAHLTGGDPAADEAALATVRLDKEREAEDGFDGSRVAHPALVSGCAAAFDAVLGDRPHQLERTRDEVEVTAARLLGVRRAAGPPGRDAVRENAAVALRYLDAWLRGRGTVPLGGQLADAATAEVARVQLWQWLRHRVVTPAEVRELLDAECAELAAADPEARVAEARGVLERTALGRELPGFFSADAYPRHLVRLRHLVAVGHRTAGAA